MNPFNFNKQNLDEVVFENRNKAYGAYALRKDYPSRVVKSLLFTLLTLLILFFISFFTHSIKVNPQLLPDAKGGDKPKVNPVKFDEKIELVSGFEIILDPVNFKIVPDKQLAQKPLKKAEVKKLVTAAIASISAVGSSAGPALGGMAIPGLGGLGGTGTLPIVGGGESNEILDAASVGVMAEFPGGLEAMYTFIGKHLNYPSLARENGKEGKVVISFIISRNGEVQQIEVERSLGFGCDEEAVRVIESMPLWTPATQNDKPVAVRMVLPIVFRLQ